MNLVDVDQSQGDNIFTAFGEWLLWVVFLLQKKAKIGYFFRKKTFVLILTKNGQYFVYKITLINPAEFFTSIRNGIGKDYLQWKADW
jgi:hypothetical protein